MSELEEEIKETTSMIKEDNIKLANELEKSDIYVNKLEKERGEFKRSAEIRLDKIGALEKENTELKKQIEDLEIAFKCVNDKNDELKKSLDERGIIY